MPTVKFGRSSSEDEFGLTATEKRIETWCRDTATNIEIKLHKVSEALAFKKLHSFFLD